MGRGGTGVGGGGEGPGSCLRDLFTLGLEQPRSLSQEALGLRPYLPESLLLDPLRPLQWGQGTSQDLLTSYRRDTPGPCPSSTADTGAVHTAKSGKAYLAE